MKKKEVLKLKLAKKLLTKIDKKGAKYKEKPVLSKKEENEKIINRIVLILFGLFAVVGLIYLFTYNIMSDFGGGGTII